MIKSFIEKYKKMSLVAKATLCFTICNIFQKCLSVLTTPFFTRMMTTEQYGQVTVYNSWLQILTLLCTLRLDYGVLYKGLSKFDSDKNGYIASMQGFSSLLTVILLAVYLILRDPINKITELTTFLSVVMFVEVFATSTISYWSGRARYEYEYKKIVVLTVSMSTLNVFLSYLAVYFSEHKDVARIVTATTVQLVFGVAIYINTIRRTKKFIVSEYVKYAVLFNLPLLPHYLSTYILDQSDRIMIQKMVGLSEAAIYGVAYNAAVAIKVISHSINNALIPWEYKKLEERDYRSLNKTFNSFMLLFMLAAILFISFAPEMIYILGGERYAQAVYCIPPVTASCFFTFVWGVYGNAEFYFDANKFTMYISMAGAVLNLILNYIFINIYGYIAAAYTTLFCYMLFTISHFIFINKLSNKKCGQEAFDAKSLTLFSILIVVCSFIMSVLYSTIYARYCIILIMCGSVFLYRKKIKELLTLND